MYLNNKNSISIKLLRVSNEILYAILGSWRRVVVRGMGSHFT